MMKNHGLYQSQIHTYAGFYQDSLTDNLAETLRTANRDASLVCIDCDLYESAVPVFNFIEMFLQEGTVIYIDDYWTGYRGNPNQGVSKAFKEFSSKSNWKFEEYLSIGWAGKSFITYM